LAGRFDDPVTDNQDIRRIEVIMPDVHPDAADRSSKKIAVNFIHLLRENDKMT